MAQHHAIAVVGAGPRGTSVVERLCASAPRLLPPGDRLTVHVVDPEPAGPGRVWRSTQSPELLMNTVASQVTLFTDDSVDLDGPVRGGPSLFEWHERRAPGRLGPDDYPTRALYGRYLEWVFGEVVRTAPPSTVVQVHRARAQELTEANGAQRLTLSDGTVTPELTTVILAQGHLPTRQDATQQHLAWYARTHGLTYLPPANPADITGELGTLAPGSNVLLRGLGLNFFDHMALLTVGRGGRFTACPSSPTELRYLPSGNEPRLYAGSRRGVPYHARGDNAKGAYGRHQPLLLTPEVIAAFRARAESGDPPDFRTQVWPLVAKEVETVYYETLLAHVRKSTEGGSAAFRVRFLSTAHGSAEESAVLEEFGLDDDQWDWRAIADPCAGRSFSGPGQFREWLLTQLRRDVDEAWRGNVAGPVKAALDVLRDLRNELRQIVDHRGLTGASRRDHLDRWYTPLNAFLSIGPPRRRIAEMAALIEAGVLEVLGPRMEIATERDGFTARSPLVPGATHTAGALIEARLPEPDLRLTADPLLRDLLNGGQCRPHTVHGYETGGLDVTARPYRLIERSGRAHPRRFAVGVPTEGVHWVTAAGARPGVNSVTLTDTDAVACAALLSLAAPAPDTVPEGARLGEAPLQDRRSAADGRGSLAKSAT